MTYVDGYTPWQIDQKLHQIKVDDKTWFYEDDLTAQDKQTDKHSINQEMWWYINHLGISENIINLWKEAHNKWYGRNQEVAMVEDGMRQTGQATTAIGNAFTNIISKSRTLERYFNRIEIMLILGDDNLIVMQEKPDLMLSVQDAKLYYNMENKPTVSQSGGTFLRMQLYRDKSGFVAMGRTSFA